ncbi:MAG: metallophosphoesterase family protein [Planctomycetota bacterium]
MVSFPRPGRPKGRPLLAAAALALLPALHGCLRPDPAPRFTPAWEHFDPAEGDWWKTDKVLLVADCQLHNLWSDALPERNLSSEALAATAIRPPQLDLFAADVLEWILAHGSDGYDAIIHLGDALDLACEGELQAFLEVMAKAGKPWLMAPGNHDFFYFGTYDPEDKGLWQAACHHSGSVLPKDRFVKLYVAALLREDDPSLAALAAALGVEAPRERDLHEVADDLPDDFDWVRDGGSGVLRRIAWHLVPEEPWRSYVIQEADMSPDRLDPKIGRQFVLLLDSCQYQRRPGLIPNGWQTFPLVLNCGSHGEMLPDQLRKVRGWIDEDRATLGPVGYAMACHHPFEAMAPRTKSSLGWLWREHGLGMLVTAHTHKGYFAHHDLGTENDRLELNLGSTTDWPMEWRTLQGFARLDTKQIYLRAERHTLVEELKQRDGYFLEAWEIPRDARDDYRRYKQGHAASGILVDFALIHHITPYWLPQPTLHANAAAIETETQVKDTLLWTFFRLLQLFPTDPGDGGVAWPDRCANDREVIERIVQAASDAEGFDRKVALLQELQRFERTRRSKDPTSGASTDLERARYKLSQAAWASRFESSRGRRLSVEDELIRVDWERTVDPAVRSGKKTGTEEGARDGGGR